MKNRYRAFRRGWGTYYCEDTQTGKQESLATKDKHEAMRLVHAKNEGEQHPGFSLQLARVYWKAGDPAGATRTWAQVMAEAVKTKAADTRRRWEVAIKHKAFAPLLDRVVLETSKPRNRVRLKVSVRMCETGVRCASLSRQENPPSVPFWHCTFGESV